jgi:hypothetical protein
MTTISELQRKLKAFNTFAKKTTGDASALQTKWKSLFSEPLSNTSAITFIKYYRDMRNSAKQTTRKQRGGMAPLNYDMTPGANVSVYGRFPVEVGTDMASIRDLDVYFSNSLTTGCGTENSSLTVPVEMGSNKVGGGKSRKSRKSRVNRKTVRSARKNLRSRSRRNRSTRRMRGGDWWDYRPYWASVPPNNLQSMSQSYAGVAPPASGDPTNHQWQYLTSGSTSGTINPGTTVTDIKSNLSMLANPAPWQS